MSTKSSKPLDTVYANSAREMRQLQSQIQQLEDTVLTIVERRTPPTSAEIRELQDFDLISQTLGGLSTFFDSLREQVGTQDCTDINLATQDVTLQLLRDRLRERNALFEL
ncbi:MULTISPECIES: hypothetical protein [Tritonibacter]|uniref:Uncharacterized protein n=1 Tax=Tritonibacter scottomollicae TaxID=483013 RepID=A0A2T1ACJ5_TRISK|nr:hypothetical protein [Tritonibacter scottomollicae]PRZ46247.1 hypothetical protein CLV89_111138 [Tritonibacter scottomollicae]WOI31375.1 hypothetical protein R1T40_00615 [Tritonibacter scottomollicae]